MILYISLSFAAALVQILTIYLLRVGLLKSFLFAIPLILIHQFLFLFNYTKAPNFTLIWFLTTVITNSLGFLVGYFIFKDTLTAFQLVGIVFILTGVIFLKF